MNKKDLNDVFTFISPTEEQKIRSLKRLMEKERKSMKFNKKILFALCIAVAAAGVTVTATMPSWNEKLIRYFKPTAEQIESLAGAVNSPEISQTNNGVTVSVLNTVVDSHGLYTLYEVTLPDDITVTQELMDKNLSWDMRYLNFKTDEPQNVYGIRSESIDVVDFSEHKITFMLFENTAHKILNNQIVRLKCENLVYFEDFGDGNVEKKLLKECDFDLSWELNYEDLSKKIEVNKPVNLINGKENTLKSVEISPLTIWVQVEGADAMGVLNPIVKMKNGGEFTLNDNAASGESNCSFASYTEENGGGETTLNFRFSKIQSISDFESITVGGLTIDLG